METRNTPKKRITNPTAKVPTKEQKLWVYGLGIGALLGGGFLLFNFFKDRANGGGDTIIFNPKGSNSNAPSRPTAPPGLPAAPNPVVIQNRDKFPLKRGSRGSVVQLLQKGLLAIGGSAAQFIRSTSMRGGVPDGIFGSGTAKALRAAGFSSVVTEKDFTRLLNMTRTSAAGTPATPSAQGIAASIIKGANERNLFSVLAGLKKIPNAKAYVSVSRFFNNVRITGTRVTSLVNALLSVAFRSDEPAKIKIRAEFRRMGLTQNNRGIWSIPSLGSLETTAKFNSYLRDEQLYDLAVTDRTTVLKSADGSFITPPLNPNTLVGYIAASHKGITQIIAQNGEIVYAPTDNLRII